MMMRTVVIVIVIVIVRVMMVIVGVIIVGVIVMMFLGMGVMMVGLMRRRSRFMRMPMLSGTIGLGFDLYVSIAASANRTHQSTSNSLILSSSPAVT